MDWVMSDCATASETVLSEKAALETLQGVSELARAPRQKYIIPVERSPGLVGCAVGSRTSHQMEVLRPFFGHVHCFLTDKGQFHARRRAFCAGNVWYEGFHID
jgi:hypothetical protein